MLVFLIGGG
ncbi:hypothetical protein LINGRAHAP2_LOCUS965 [Linum grandiflorum]